VSSVIYDAAVLIAAERNDRRVWADHRARLELAMVPLVPATVVAQVSRSARQVQLHRFLRGCDVVPLDEHGAHAAGRLLGATRTVDVVDASVVALAAARGAKILTGDADDLARLAGATGRRLAIEEV
jgi:predicted nucleic acid-binding protein